MNTSDLNIKVTLQELTYTIDDNGIESETWADFKPLWANKKEVSSIKKDDKNIDSNINCDFTIRFSNTIFKYLSEKPLGSLRIFFNNRVYQIGDFFILDEKNTFIRVKCIRR